jgi:transcriptional regulator with XRE-family HTH domain
MAVMTLGEFLRSRRAALTPEAAGIVSYGARRVPGLRREELAQLAGVSPAYYTRLEQGQSTNASPSVLDALARALELDEDERQHLHALASSPAAGRPRASRPQQARPSLVALLEAMPDVPAVVMDARSEVLAWNDLGHRLLAGHVAGRPNLTRMLFLDPHTRELYRDWEQETARAVASLRFIAGRFRDDRRLAELIGELTLKSPEFAALWGRHPVKRCTTGLKRMHHPEVGELDLCFEVLHLPDDSGQRLLTHTAAPGSEGALALLSRGRATPAR